MWSRYGFFSAYVPRTNVHHYRRFCLRSSWRPCSRIAVHVPASDAWLARTISHVQVVKLAEQLAGLLRAKQADEADAMGRMRVALDSAALRMAGEEQARWVQDWR